MPIRHRLAARWAPNIRHRLAARWVPNIRRRNAERRIRRATSTAAHSAQRSRRRVTSTGAPGIRRATHSAAHSAQRIPGYRAEPRNLHSLVASNTSPNARFRLLGWFRERNRTRPTRRARFARDWLRVPRNPGGRRPARIRCDSFRGRRRVQAPPSRYRANARNCSTDRPVAKPEAERIARSPPPVRCDRRRPLHVARVRSRRSLRVRAALRRAKPAFRPAPPRAPEVRLLPRPRARAGFAASSCDRFGSRTAPRAGRQSPKRSEATRSSSKAAPGYARSGRCTPDRCASEERRSARG